MKDEYLNGWKNRIIRLYFYLLKGLGTASEFRNIGLAIFGLYITLKLTDPYLMAVMFVASIVVLTPTGWFMVHKVSKVQEWLQTKYGSHYAIKNFDYVEATYKEMVEIRKLLEKLNK